MITDRHGDLTEWRARERGLALVIVLWAGAILAMLATALSHRAREDIILVRNLLDATRAELAADSGLHHALEQVLISGPEMFFAGSAFQEWSFAGSQLRIEVTDELARIDINAAPGELLADLFVAVGTDGAEAQMLAAAIVAYRSQGASAALSVGAPDADDGGFSTAEELINVPGMTRPLFDRVVGAITVLTGRRTPQTQNASALVLAALQGDVPSETESADGRRAEDRADIKPRRRRGSSLLRFHVEARAAGGSVFAREAVVLIRSRSGGSTKAIWLWQRGQRRLF